MKELKRAEWDFSGLEDASTDELVSCQIYEYARESALVLAIRDVGLGKREPPPGLLPLGNLKWSPHVYAESLFYLRHEDFPSKPWCELGKRR